MKKLALGVILFLLVVSTFGTLIVFLVLALDDAVRGAEWEINFMRAIATMTIIGLAIPSVYKWYRHA